MLQNRKIETLSKEVCPGWIDWAPANAWSIIYKARAQDINATTAKGIQRASEALENRAKRLKPAHMTGPMTQGHDQDTGDCDTDQGSDASMANRSKQESPGTHWQDEGEQENPAKRPHIENNTGEAGFDNRNTDTGIEHMTQNGTQLHTQTHSD